MSTVRALIISMRPKQWTKNLVVFAPLIFSHELAEPGRFLAAAAAFASLCLVSGAVYLLNDVIDAERDRVHAKKCRRPIARGDLSEAAALSSGAVAAVGGLAIAFVVAPEVFASVLAYLALQVAYTLWLKHWVLLDAFSISGGFVLRATAGAYAVGTSLSPWLYAAVSLLALFLAFGKRRHELLLLDTEAVAHRPALEQYSPQLLDALLSSVTAATVVTYSMYSFSSQTAQAAPGLMYTVPFVMFGLFRYLYLIYSRNMGGNPEEILLTDWPLIAAILLWLAASVAALYV